LAEGIAREYAKKYQLEVLIDSAGTGNWHIGEPPCPNSIKVAKMHGIDISDIRARQIVTEDLKRFNLVIALDESNKETLKKMGAKNLSKLGDFGFDGADVPDPYFFDGFEGFIEVFNMIDICVKNLFRIKFKVKELE
jgi:protein-tyrosine phosphatase